MRVFSREAVENAIRDDLPPCPVVTCRSANVIALQRPRYPVGYFVCICMECGSQRLWEAA